MISPIIAFRDKCKDRIPSALEFLDFVEAQGWRVAQQADGRPTLRVHDKNDPLARAMARMLGREPYRTNVLAEMAKRWRAAQPEVRQKPATDPNYRAREWLWSTGHIEGEGWGCPTWAQPGTHKQTAFWWRHRGEKVWRPVPGTNPEARPIPVGEQLEGGNDQAG
jgi:hypothetical protein